MHVVCIVRCIFYTYITHIYMLLSQVSVPVAGGEANGGVEEDKSRTLTLPAGTVLAYEVRELAIDKKGRRIKL